MTKWSRLFSLCIIFVFAEFAEYPENITLPIGSKTNAVFRCRHQSLEVIIDWRVNGLPRRQLPNITIGSVTENDITVDLLIIPARSEYNGTEVECEAFFRNGPLPEVTPPATLTIIAGLINYSSSIFRQANYISHWNITSDKGPVIMDTMTTTATMETLITTTGMDDATTMM